MFNMILIDGETVLTQDRNAGRAVSCILRTSTPQALIGNDGRDHVSSSKCILRYSVRFSDVSKRRQELKSRHVSEMKKRIRI